MNSTKNTSRIVGILFLVQMITASVSHSAILVPLLYGDDFLVAVSENSNSVIAALLLDLVCGASVFGIGVLLFPILKKHSEPIALWHLGLRLNEWVLLTISGIFLLTLIAISKEYAGATMSEHSNLQHLGNYFLKARGYAKILMLLGFCLSAYLFYYLLLKSRLLPRFISIWGLIGVLLLFAEVVSNIYGQSLGGIIVMLPMGLNEIFLGIWLIVKGFNQSAITQDKTD
ncbi:MAG: DUF4386 domain-containing protein [Chitinophagales bacterium]